VPDHSYPSWEILAWISTAQDRPNVCLRRQAPSAEFDAELGCRWPTPKTDADADSDVVGIGVGVARIRRYGRDLGEQLRSALSSIALNLAESNRSQGGHRIARFSTAAGSNSESRAALRVAVAWGYIEPLDIEAGNRLLDRVAAMLHRPGARQ
jgi:four helix bundle protein